MQVVGYSMARDIVYQNHSVISEIAERTGRTSYQVALKWANQKGVVSIFGSGTRWQQEQNLEALQGPDLSADDITKIESLDKNRAIFWQPDPTIQTCRH